MCLGFGFHFGTPPFVPEDPYENPVLGFPVRFGFPLLQEAWGETLDLGFLVGAWVFVPWLFGGKL